MATPLHSIGDIAEQIRGVTYRKQDASTSKRDGYLPILRAGNITNFGLTYKDLVYVPSPKISPRQMVRENDILIAASSGSIEVVGKAARALEDFEGSFGAFCKVLRLKKQVDATYFSHFFKTPEYRRKISSLAAGANINNLKNEDLDSLKIPLPTLAEQKRIAAILDAADQLRTKRREAIAQLDAFLQSTFIEMFGDPITNPMGWKDVKFSECISSGFRNGISPSARGTVPGEVLTLSAITGGRFSYYQRRFANFDRPPSEKQCLAKDTFLICRGNGNKNLVGAGTFPDRHANDVCFPDTMIGVTVDSSKIFPAYLKMVWGSRMVRRQIEQGARTTNGTYKVNQSLLSKIFFLSQI